MIFPEGSPADSSPLHVICCNDTCSFTWTGAEHINQDIFECRTCGLTDSLCCCTECARVCHKGHDCKLKRTSPTAYCDCWEKCRCRSTVGGHQGARFDVLTRLVSETGLVEQPNGREENILLFYLNKSFSNHWSFADVAEEALIVPGQGFKGNKLGAAQTSLACKYHSVGE